MIHEWRRYRLKPGAATQYLSLLAERGLPLVTRHLPLMGYWLAETGPLNVIHHLWCYADWGEREACRAGLAAEEGWVNGFVPAAFPLVEEQVSCLLRPVAGSPSFDAALARRRAVHPPLAAGAPLFADRCAALIRGEGGLAEGALAEGALTEGAVALWQVVSGGPGGRVGLLPRRADPLPRDPLTRDPLPRDSASDDPLSRHPPSGAAHVVLRPLAFSPL